MCFAPRYMSGPIAAPLMPWRNSASDPDTPCASPFVPINNTSASESAITPSEPARPRLRGRLLRAAVLGVAGVTRFIDGLFRRKDVLGVPGFGRDKRLPSRVDHP